MYFQEEESCDCSYGASCHVCAPGKAREENDSLERELHAAKCELAVRSGDISRAIELGVDDYELCHKYRLSGTQIREAHRERYEATRPPSKYHFCKCGKALPLHVPMCGDCFTMALFCSPVCR